MRQFHKIIAGNQKNNVAGNQKIIPVGCIKYLKRQQSVPMRIIINLKKQNTIMVNEYATLETDRHHGMKNTQHYTVYR